MNRSVKLNPQSHKDKHIQRTFLLYLFQHPFRISNEFMHFTLLVCHLPDYTRNAAHYQLEM
jgi:hypothetical protein